MEFPQKSLASECRCMEDIHEFCIKLTEKALDGNEYLEYYIRDEEKHGIKSAIEKQTKVDYTSSIYNFKMRLTIRKLELPILSGIQYRSLLPSIWNRCNNGYDVATGIII